MLVLEKNPRVTESRIGDSVCLWWHMYLRLIVVWYSDLETLRQFSGHVQMGVEGSRGL